MSPLTVYERLQISEEREMLINQTVLYSFYIAYADANGGELSVGSIIDEVFSRFSGNELTAAMYLVGAFEECDGTENQKSYIGKLFLAAHILYGRIRISYDEFTQVQDKVADHLSLELIGSL